MRTRLFPSPVVSNRMYFADDNAGGGGGEPAGDQAPEESFQMPDKFQGKAAEDIAKSYLELEKQLGSKGNSDADVSEIKNQLSELRQSLESANKKPDDTEEAQKIQRDYFEKLGFVRGDRIDAMKEEARKEFEFDRQMSELGKEYDGKDGRPKFVAQDIAKYAQENGFRGSPLSAYRAMHFDALNDWTARKALEGNKANHVPKGGGKPSPKGDAPNLSKMSADERKAIIHQRLLAEQE